MGRDKGKRARVEPGTKRGDQENQTRRVPGLEEGEDVDIASHYGAPFLVHWIREGNLYLSLSKLVINPYCVIESDCLSTLGIRRKFIAYLKALNLMRYESMALVGDKNLCLEFCTTFAKMAGSYQMYCRLRGHRVELSVEKMHRIFGFSKSENAAYSVPEEFDTHGAWRELSGFNNWTNSGMSPALLKEPALLVLHKFLAFNVSGKKEANKVNADEVFLLHSAVHNKSVSITGFMWKSILGLKSQSTAHPAFPQVAMAIARFEGIVSEDEDFELTRSIVIDYAHLKNAKYVRNENEWVPYEERIPVINARARESRGGSSSRAPQQHSSAPLEEETEYERTPSPTPYTNEPPQYFAAFQSRFDGFMQQQNENWLHLDSVLRHQHHMLGSLDSRVGRLEYQLQNWSLVGFPSSASSSSYQGPQFPPYQAPEYPPYSGIFPPHPRPPPQ